MKKPGSLRRDSRTGQVLVGRGAFAKISAVEGIQVPADMDADFAELDREQATPSQRRTVLAAKYGAKKR